MTTDNLTLLCDHRGLAACGQAPFSGAHSRYGSGLYLTYSGRARLAQIQGYLAGLAHAGKSDYAEALAADLLRSLRYLDTYGGTEETPWGTLPRYRVLVSSDSSPLSFSLAWVKRDEEPQQSAGAAMDEHYNFFALSKWVDGAEHAFYWRRLFNGGLLYHGPSGAPMAVTLDDSFWSVHT
jgi:hypothetical protein